MTGQPKPLVDDFMLSRLDPDEIPVGYEELWQVLLRVFGRTPTLAEVERWGAKLDQNLPAKAFIRQLAASRHVKDSKFVRTKNPPGHFFSPVVDPDLVGEYVRMSRAAATQEIPGIDFPLAEMEAFWERSHEFIAATPFTRDRTPDNRYFYGGGPYHVGDAMTLRAMINDLRPKRVIEMGSGYSTACMLDAAEHAGLKDFKVVCIEPFPDRLHSVLRPDDIGNGVTLLKTTTQSVPLSVFRDLEPNDILFIDSTHVLKTGSDVHYQLFFILPLLPPGVVVHVHDCRFPLEYSDKQIFEKNYSWNEVYAIRALLMFSNRYRVIFSGSFFAKRRPDLIQQTAPLYLRNPGSALWFRVIGE